jgi:parallel beta-helix repeat protein
LKKLVSVIILILLFASILNLAFNIEPVRASGTIYIQADGSIDPSTANITTTDNVTYSFVDNNYDPVWVKRSNIVIDGNGYVLQGVGTGTGVYVYNVQNVTIKNVVVKSFASGIWLHSSYNNTIVGNGITNISAYGSYGSIILSGGASNNTIAGNNITNSDRGIYMYTSAGNTLRNNHLSGNQYNFGVYGAMALEYYVQDIDSSNTVDGKPVYYWVNHDSEIVPANPGYVALVNSTNITVQDLVLKNNTQLLLLAFTENSLVAYNNMTEGQFDGIYMVCSSNNTIVGNSIADCDAGIEIWNVTDNVIAENNITEGVYGVHIRDSSYNNTIVGNNIVDNGYGFYIEGDSSNTIYHNNFIDNFGHTVVFSGTDVWDNGYPYGGNYWDDYTGIDEKSGPYQNETGSDGIGDTPYTFNGPYGGTYVDNYPLMNPWKPLLGDLNWDGAVNILDVVAIASIYNCVEGEPNWNLRADLAPPYGKIDILDLVTCTSHYGQKYY